ncbi:MAG: hypothetical protein U1U88_001224 [Lawsonella clevelandensis]
MMGVPCEPRSTRIMVSVPRKAADDPTVMDNLLGAGAEIARINLVYDNATVWKKMAGHIRETALHLHRTIPIAVDLPGPRSSPARWRYGPRVGSSTVVRYDDGEMRYPSRLWLVPESLEGNLPEPPEMEGTRPLRMMVENEWFENLELGIKVRTADNRGVQRSFLVMENTTTVPSCRATAPPGSVTTPCWKPTSNARACGASPRCAAACTWSGATSCCSPPTSPRWTRRGMGK